MAGEIRNKQLYVTDILNETALSIWDVFSYGSRLVDAFRAINYTESLVIKRTDRKKTKR